MEAPIGRLEPVPLRDVWPHEARDFSAWLLSNGDALGEALGIDLEITEAEHPVGGYSMDLIGKDLSHGGQLVIENELERTDHDHLGKVITYAAGAGASTVVWLAREFREEHRQALDWLNEHTDEGLRFFGVVVKAVRIGSSAPAPLFDVVASPNDWQKQVRAVANADATANGKAVLYKEFWGKFLERLRRDHPSWSRARIPTNANWMNLPSPIRGTLYGVNFASGRRLCVELYIDRGSVSDNLAVLEILRKQRGTIEAASGLNLDFQELEGRRAKRIAVYRDDSDVADVGHHEDFLAWFFATLGQLRNGVAKVPREVFTSSGSDGADEQAQT